MRSEPGEGAVERLDADSVKNICLLLVAYLHGIRILAMGKVNGGKSFDLILRQTKFPFLA